MGARLWRLFGGNRLARRLSGRVGLVDEPGVPRGEAQGTECGDDEPTATVFTQEGQDDEC